MDAAAARLGEDRVRLPRRWYVIDAPVTNASVVGSTLFVTRELVSSPFLDGVLAHELGHLNSLDGRIALALSRIPYPGPAWIARQLEDAELSGMAFWWRVLVAGGQGQRTWPISALWSWYWRRREYSADRFAANVGGGEDLIGYLEDYPLAVDTATPFMRNMTHPYVEHRLDRLMRRGASAIAGG
jgi:Zn-dependent protease with chaperone function